MRGRFYLYFQSFVVDLFGALVMVGIGMAPRGVLTQAPGKKLVYTNEATLILAAIFLMCLQGFLIEGWRIAATNDPWGAWSPFGNLVALASRALMTDAQMQAAHWGLWWFHLATVFGFIAWAPLHEDDARHHRAAEHLYRQPRPAGLATLKHLDFEKTESFRRQLAQGFYVERPTRP